MPPSSTLAHNLRLAFGLSQSIFRPSGSASRGTTSCSG